MRDSNAWLEVDLGDDYPIDKVVIKNRWCRNESDEPMCLCRLSSAEILLLDDSGLILAEKNLQDTCGVHTLSSFITDRVLVEHHRRIVLFVAFVMYIYYVTVMSCYCSSSLSQLLLNIVAFHVWSTKKTKAADFSLSPFYAQSAFHLSHFNNDSEIHTNFTSEITQWILHDMGAISCVAILVGCRNCFHPLLLLFIPRYGGVSPGCVLCK